MSGTGFPPTFIHTLGLVKYAAAVANEALGLLDGGIATAIRAAAQEVIAGKHDKEFVVDIFQTGSGTSTNRNANEVIANRALELIGKDRDGKEIHPKRSCEYGTVEQRCNFHRHPCSRARSDKQESRACPDWSR